MTLDEAIAHAKEVASKVRKNGNYLHFRGNERIANECDECASEHEQLAEWLEELKARREADRWIPVSERLPKSRVAVMVYCPEHKNQYCAFYADKHWQVFGAYDTVWEEVIAWRPLPEPYKGSEDNK